MKLPTEDKQANEEQAALLKRYYSVVNKAWTMIKFGLLMDRTEDNWQELTDLATEICKQFTVSDAQKQVVYDIVKMIEEDRNRREGTE